MTWPLRLEFPEAVHWVQSFGVGHRTIASDEGDRQGFIDYLGRCVQRFDWVLYTYALLPDRIQLLADGRARPYGQRIRRSIP